MLSEKLDLRKQNIHLMGVGGSGMSALAVLLHEIGANVSGCDTVSSSYTEKLESQGIPVKIGHDQHHINEFMANILVYSSAIPNDHPEILRAWQQGITVCRRAEILSAVFNSHRGVGVAGTHGKTTTSSMISVVLENAGLDPSIAVGGEVLQLKTNAKLGKGEFMSAELDESDRSFVYFHPEIAVVTNIDWDHRDHYMTFKSVTDAFAEFLSNVKENGCAILYSDDPGVKILLKDYKIDKEIVTYGLGKDFDYGALNLSYIDGGGIRYDLYKNGKFVTEIELQISGEHNVLNSLATIAACEKCGLSIEQIKPGLALFIGAKRRLQKKGEVAGVLVYDDYGHHPSEIAATLKTMRQIFKNRRIVAIFQPHRFSRTAALYKEFAEALSLADRALILPIYGSDEKPIDGISSKLIFDAASNDARSHYELSGSFDDLVNTVCNVARPGDVFLTLGAGSVGTLGEKILDNLKKTRL